MVKVTRMEHIEINNEAQEFNIKDNKGNIIKLSDYKNQKNVYLVFNRGFM